MTAGVDGSRTTTRRNPPRAGRTAAGSTRRPPAQRASRRGSAALGLPLPASPAIWRQPRISRLNRGGRRSLSRAWVRADCAFGAVVASTTICSSIQRLGRCRVKSSRAARIASARARRAREIEGPWPGWRCSACSRATLPEGGKVVTGAGILLLIEGCPRPIHVGQRPGPYFSSLKGTCLRICGS